MKFCAVDACHSRHHIYHSGRLHLLTTRDGNNKVVVLAWCYAEIESADTYQYFADQCHAAGLSPYLGAATVIFSDRMKGIEMFHNRFRAMRGRCFVHIIKNAKTHIRGSGTTFQDELAWAIQKAVTRAEYDRALERMRLACPMAAAYFGTLECPDEIFQYALNEKKVPCHGHKSSNIVEGPNGVFKYVRDQCPYRANNLLLKWCGERFAERVELITKWITEEKHHLTPYAHHLWQIQVS